MPPSPSSEAKKVQYTATTYLRVNDGKIISEMLRNVTDFAAEARAEMEVQAKYQQPNIQGIVVPK
jgi:hypothetical protein